VSDQGTDHFTAHNSTVGVQGVNQGTVNIHAPTPEQRLHQLRAPVADFVGRAQAIAELRQALTAGDGAATVIGIRGMGGIGKTELAMVVANQLAEQFPDGQIVVELFGASNPVSAEAALQSVIRAFEPQAKLPDDRTRLKQHYAACLNGKRVLVLADDAKDAAQVHPLMPPTGCALLVTSRQTFTLPGMQRVDLGTLDAAEAKALLLSICPRIGEHAPMLADICGYLPLALRVSASVLANDDTRSVARYLEQLQQERLKHLRDPDQPDDPAASVEASLKLSYAALPAAAQHTFAKLGVFVGDFTEEAAIAVLDLPTKNPNNEKGTTKWLRGLFSSASPTHHPSPSTLSLLTRRSLLDYDLTTGRYELHDLVRAFALNRLPNERTVRLHHAWYYIQICWKCDHLYKVGGENTVKGLALFDQERQQIDSIWNWLLGQQETDPDVDRALIDLANAIVYVGDLRYDLQREQIPQLEAQAAAARRLREKQYESDALGNLGIAYHNLGDYQAAIAYHNQNLDMARKIGNQRSEGNALGNLGNTYNNLGDYQRAIEYHKQHLIIAQEIGNQRMEGNILNNLGIAYNSRREYEKAIECHEQSLRIARNLGDRRGEGSTLDNLGSVYYSLGDYQKAITYHKQRIDIAHEIGDLRGESTGLGNLGNISYLLGNVQQAVSFYEQAIKKDQEIANKEGIARHSWNLGLLCEAQGDLARAESLIAQAVDFTQQVGHIVHEEQYTARLARLRAKLQELGG
jgi:tetratricopeptide (TPR) repeat protein